VSFRGETETDRPGQILIATLALTWRHAGIVLAFHTDQAKPFTNSTRLRNAIPEGPFAIQGF